jgi:glycosyltransferase involved in cell wall biosynthesis
MKKKILLFADWYAPGFKAGGPIRSCVNFAQHMRQHFEVYVFTSDRDLGSDAPYEGVARDCWGEAQPGLHVFYASPEKQGFAQIRREILEVAPDFIYLNSMFSPHFTLFPLWAARGMGKARPAVVLSPRGMLRVSALRYKAFKKKLFLKAFHISHLHRIIHFHAADAEEEKDIRRHFGPSTAVSLIPNLPALAEDEPVFLEKVSGDLSMIFVGRVHPIKNLDYLLKLLSRLPAPPGKTYSIRLTIVGSEEDKDYWKHCQQLIETLPPAISVDFMGQIPNDRISGLVKQHHIFVLPTQGENFGHAIFEALCAHRPVLISDQTPWRHLSAARAGWEFPLQDPTVFGGVVVEALEWDQTAFDEWSAGAFDFACRHRAESGALEKYRELFS